MPALGHRVSSLTFTGVDDALLLGFGGACSKGGHIMATLGVADLNFFFGVALFLFSVVSLFLKLGLVSGSGGLNWLTGAGIIGPILFSTSRKVFIFDNGEVQVEFHGPRYAPNQLGCSIPSENVHPLH